jgi:hypothetical protein
MSAPAEFEHVAELAAHGWRLVEEALAGAASDRALVTHWFVTPDDSSVHTDEHFGSNERTVTFVGVVVPTLADQLDASVVVVAVPWNRDGRPSLLVLVAALRGQPAAVEARALTPSVAVRDGLPWWSLGTEPVEVPPALLNAVAHLVL